MNQDEINDYFNQDEAGAAEMPQYGKSNSAEDSPTEPNK